MKDVFRVFDTLLRTVQRRTPPGAMPGTVSIDPALPPPVIDRITYNSVDFSHERDCSAEDVCVEMPSDRVTWINVEGLGDEAVVRKLATHFELHPLTVEDIAHVTPALQGRRLQ